MIKPELSSTGGRLRYARFLAGKTSAGLADAAGVARMTVSAIENNRRKTDPSATTLKCLADALGVNAAWLAFAEGSMGPAAEHKSGLELAEA